MQVPWLQDAFDILETAKKHQLFPIVSLAKYCIGKMKYGNNKAVEAQKTGDDREIQMYAVFVRPELPPPLSRSLDVMSLSVCYKFVCVVVRGGPLQLSPVSSGMLSAGKEKRPSQHTRQKSATSGGFALTWWVNEVHSFAGTNTERVTVPADSTLSSGATTQGDNKPVESRTNTEERLDAGDRRVGSITTGEDSATDCERDTGQQQEGEEPSPSECGAASSLPSQQQRQQPMEGILERVKGVQEKAGKMQAKIHGYNAFLLKVRSLFLWSDPVRTKALMAGVTALALVLVIIPMRYMWSATVLFLFSKPIRPQDPVLIELLWMDFWQGLPEESSTHRNMHMDAIYRHQASQVFCKIHRRVKGQVRGKKEA
ncbi:unnamed protein product [Choristocarpus tenellus]